MKKLWQKKNEKLNKLVESFETKDDLLLDEKLVPFDVQGSLAHAKMLEKIGIISTDELSSLAKGLGEILKLYEIGQFKLQMGDEDVHTKIEGFITDKYGEVGKKIHTARSRNDQVLTALRLYSKSELIKVQDLLNNLVYAFEKFEKNYGGIDMPGYTHMQKAMPSTLNMWSSSFQASLNDDLFNINSVLQMIDQSPLGSAAGYGVPIEIDKKYTAKLLGFKKVQENPIYCQNSRGKFEAVIVGALINILLTINKFATDVMLFNTSEFGFFKASAEVTTGSSIMPQKKNLDLAELLRSKVHVLLGNYCILVSLSSNLPSGYNRDMQESKKPLMESFEITKDCLKVAQVLLGNIHPDKKRLKSAMTEEIFETQKTLELVIKGINFRDAYKKIGNKYTNEKGGELNDQK